MTDRKRTTLPEGYQYGDAGSVYFGRAWLREMDDEIARRVYHQLDTENTAHGRVKRNREPVPAPDGGNHRRGSTSA